MIPNLILKLKNFLLKKKLSNSQILFNWQSLAKKKERKRRKMKWLLDGFNSQKWENQILKDH